MVTDFHELKNRQVTGKQNPNDNRKATTTDKNRFVYHSTRKSKRKSSIPTFTAISS